MEPTQESAGTTQSVDSDTWAQIKAELRAAYGEDIYTSWFERIEFESSSDVVVNLSTPTSFIRH